MSQLHDDLMEPKVIELTRAKSQEIEVSLDEEALDVGLLRRT